MYEDFVLYQLMDMRLNEAFNEIVVKDEKYREIMNKSNGYFEKLEALHLSEEAMELIDRYASEQNALGARYGALSYLLGFSDCVELLTKPFPFSAMKKETG